MTQRERILRYLKENPKGITQADAIKYFGAYRLSDVILKLRRSGYVIETVDEVGKNRYGEPTTYGRYILRGEMKR